MKNPGFWIKQDIFSDAECASLLECLSWNSLARSRAGKRNLMAVYEIRRIALDERLIQIGQDGTRTRLIPYKATLFEKTGKANWLVAFHQDTALPLEKETRLEGWGPSSTKEGIIFSHAPTWALSQILAIRIHLDPSTNLNGPLRVIPNSHHKRITDDAEFDRFIKTGNEVQCLVGKGGVIAMSPLLIHASSKSVNDAPRRVLHIEYARSLDLGQGVRLAIS
jgi:ectoine hydroxylase-related dioxygenase (phytanoyl-CoA dioxygenase family)